MSALATISDRISKLILMLGTDRDGEALAACRALGRTLKNAGLDFSDLAKALSDEPKTVVVYRDRPAPTETWQSIANWCRDNDRGRLTPKERQFVLQMTYRLVCGGTPTERQGEWLRAIYARLWTAR